jgi:hypothetical protein
MPKIQIYFGTEVVNFIIKLYNMKYKLLLILLFTNLIYSQTTHQLNWNMSSTNQQITIAVDDTVTWTWGSGTHNLRSTGGVEMFDSGYYGPGYQFSHTFTIPGVTTYICDPHPNSMYGTVTVTATASVAEQDIFNFNIYPTPVSDIINISLDNITNDQISIEVYDLLGRQNISTISIVTNGKTSLNISGLTKGIYVVKVTKGTAVSVKRFIKE